MILSIFHHRFSVLFAAHFGTWGFIATAVAVLLPPPPSSSFIRIVRDTRYSGTLGCANLKVSQVPEVARAAEKRAAPFRGDGKKGEKGRCKEREEERGSEETGSGKKSVEAAC